MTARNSKRDNKLITSTAGMKGAALLKNQTSNTGSKSKARATSGLK